MNRKALTVIGFVAVSVAMLAGCNTTIRTTTATFQTGKVLEQGELRATARSTVLPLPLLAGAQGAVGLPGGWEIEGGYGAHGIRIDDDDANDDTLHGPELFVTKAFFPQDSSFGLSATVGAEANLAPQFDAAIHLAANAGAYPADWFAFFGGVRGVYITGGRPGLLVNLGLGIDGPVQFKLAGYLTPTEIARDRQDGADVFWPYFINAEIGAKF